MQKRALIFTLLLALTAFAVAPAFAQDEGGMTLTPIGTYETNVFDEGGAEIAAYDAETQTLYVTNGNDDTLDLISIADPTAPELITQVDITEYGAGLNSVATQDGIVAVAVEAEEVDANGVVLFLDTAGEFIATVEVGVLPDMVTFTPDGTKVLTANEGEPNDDYSIDPEGSISIIDISEGVENATVTTAGFEAYNEEGALPEGVRIYGPGATVAQDLEPEYIVVDPDSTIAFVTLQENNALAAVDLELGEVAGILPLGFKDYSVEGNGIDASDEDGAINIQPWPVVGMYQPDAIDAYVVDGTLYLVTANEGDARDYDTYSEEARLGDFAPEDFDSEVFPNIEELLAEENLGRLEVTTEGLDSDDDGLIDRIISYGARSFTIWDALAGEIVFDSGDQLEQITAELFPDNFNSTNDENGSFDSRSDAKGPEPEGVIIAEIDGTPYAFIGLERIGGVMVYDISDPTAAEFVTYVNNRDFTGNAEEGTAGDLGPEGLVFISAEDSPTGTPLLVVTNEVSGSTTIYEISMGM